jgi:hypothetical protein
VVAVSLKTHQIVPVDAKWQPVGSRLLQHLVKEELKLSRETFYGATKATARKIGLR